MFVNHDKKVVYIRVPKTGSSAIVTSVRNQIGWDLEPYDFGFHTHTMMCQMPPQFKHRYADYTWVSGVRHPYTWIPSFYSWLKNNSQQMRELAFDEGKVEDNWLKFIGKIKVSPLAWRFDNDRIIKNVTIYKQEDTSGLANLLGVDLSQPRNVTKKRRDLELDDQIEDLIKRRFYAELAFYKDEPLEETKE